MGTEETDTQYNFVIHGNGKQPTAFYEMQLLHIAKPLILLTNWSS